MFTQDEEDIYFIKEVLTIMSAYLVLDAWHGVNTGIVRALGKQFHASVATLCCYYGFGLPLALVLGFKVEMGLVGFWLGFTIALTMQNIIVSLIIFCANWEIGTKAQEELEAKLKSVSQNESAPMHDSNT